jgi:indole-3-glycerol phosphate synthase
MTDILNEINAYKKEVIERDSKQIPFNEIRSLAEKITAKSNFLSNIEKTIAQNKPAIISEIKKKSPSQGLLKKEFNVEEIAASYAEGGASCISVLTDEKYFQGKNEYVTQVKNKSNLPVLRKDFIIDPYQIYQAKFLGADAILLIMASLSNYQAKEFEDLAHSLNMDVLVESFNETELQNSLELKTKLVGINNRNLKTLETNLENITNLHNLIPSNKITICESGINSFEDFKEIKKIGINCFLIGGFLMQESNPEKTLKKLTKI